MYLHMTFGPFTVANHFPQIYFNNSKSRKSVCPQCFHIAILVNVCEVLMFNVIVFFAFVKTHRRIACSSRISIHTLMRVCVCVCDHECKYDVHIYMYTYRLYMYTKLYRIVFKCALNYKKEPK